MLAIVAVLLVIACAQPREPLSGAGGQRGSGISRSASRSGQAALRLARQLLSETLLISFAGGALGVLVASWGVDALVWFLPGSERQPTCRFDPDRNVLLFTLAASMLTGLGIGLAPAWLAGKVDVRDMLAAGGRTLAGGGSRSERSSCCRSPCRRCWSWLPRSSR